MEWTSSFTSKKSVDGLCWSLRGCHSAKSIGTPSAQIFVPGGKVADVFAIGQWCLTVPVNANDFPPPMKYDCSCHRHGPMYHPQCGPYSRAIIDSAPPVLRRQLAIVAKYNSVPLQSLPQLTNSRPSISTVLTIPHTTLDQQSTQCPTAVQWSLQSRTHRPATGCYHPAVLKRACRLRTSESSTLPTITPLIRHH